MGLAHRSLLSPCQSFFLTLSLSFSLSLPLFFRVIPWSTEALCIHFPAWASKTRSRRRSVSSFQLEGALHLHSGERVPAASVNRASPLSGTLLAFCVNQGILDSFFLLFSHLQYYLYLSLNLFTDAISPEGSPGSCGAGPWQIAEMHIRGMTSKSPYSCIFPYIEKC